jgi:hypothetical protein
MEKICNQKNFIISFGLLLVLELAYREIFFFKFILSCQQFLPLVSFTLVANLPPMSLTPVVPLVSITLAKLVQKKLPPVSLIPVVHLDLQISLQIFEKIRNGPNGVLWCWGETDS